MLTSELLRNQSLYPIVYLLLLHHLDLIKAAKTYIVHPWEMKDAADIFMLVTDAVERRCDMLNGEQTVNLLVDVDRV